jgi:hypothetical protein
MVLLNERRENKIARTVAVDEPNWIPWDKEHYHYESLKLPRETAFASFQFRGPVSKLEIFLKFLPLPFINTIMENLSPSTWVLNESKKKRIDPKVSTILKVLAVTMRIQAFQVDSKESKAGKQPLKDAIILARDHFNTTGPPMIPGQRYPNCPGVDICSKLIGNFHIQYQHFAELSQNFQSILLSLGQFIAGDEKLFHLTGNSGYIRLVPNKPDKVGLWIYECMCQLSNGLPYMLYLRFQNSDPNIGVSIKTSEILREWKDIVLNIGKDRVPVGQSPNPACIVVSDSYYMCNTGRAMYATSVPKVNFCASVTKERFAKLAHKVQDLVTKPCQMDGMFNPITGELFVYYWDPEKGVGKKYNLSNCMSRWPGKTKDTTIPAYDEYKSMFSVCDNFNRALHDRTFPHRKGHAKIPCDQGAVHDFAFSSILQNTINVFCDICKLNRTDVVYETFLCELADSLFAYACTLI